MSALIISRHPVSPRPAWLESRRQVVTASEAAAVYGRHKYLSRLQLAYNKLYGEHEQRPDDARRRGHILEPACAAAIEHDYGIRPRKVEYFMRGVCPKNPNIRVGATLDYDVEMDGSDLLAALARGKIAHDWADLADLPVRLNIECKSVDRDVFDSEWADGPPIYHVYQALLQSMLGGYDGALIAALVVNYAHDLHLYTVPRAPGLEAKILADIGDFWAELDAGVLPAAEARDNEIMGKRNKASKGAVIDMRGDLSWGLLLEDLERVKERQNVEKFNRDAIEVRIKEAMGEHEVMLLDDWTCTWKADKRGVRTLRIERR